MEKNSALALVNEQVQVPLTLFTQARLSPALKGKANGYNIMGHLLVNRSFGPLRMHSVLYMGLAGPSLTYTNSLMP